MKNYINMYKNENDILKIENSDNKKEIDKYIQLMENLENNVQNEL